MRLLDLFTNVLPIVVQDADGEPLPLGGALVSAVVEPRYQPGRDLITPAVEVTDAEAGELRLTVGRADVATLRRYSRRTKEASAPGTAPGGTAPQGEGGVLRLVLDLGSGVVHTFSASVWADDPGPNDLPEGRSYVVPGTLTLTVSSEAGADVRAEWVAVRDLGAAIAAAEALIQTVEDIEDGAVGDMIEARDQALSQIAGAGTAAVEAVQQQQAESVEAVQAAETTTITQATTAGVEAVQGQQTTSVQAVATREGQAVDAVEQQEALSEAAVLAQELASVEAVEEEGDAQVQRVEDEGDTQVGRLDERVPDPSTEPDDQFLATLGGQSVWVPKPEGVTDREIAALDLSRIVAWDMGTGSGEDANGSLAPSGQSWETRWLSGATAGRWDRGAEGFLPRGGPMGEYVGLVLDRTIGRSVRLAATCRRVIFSRARGVLVSWLDDDNWVGVYAFGRNLTVLASIGGTVTNVAQGPPTTDITPTWPHRLHVAAHALDSATTGAVVAWLGERPHEVVTATTAEIGLGAISAGKAGLLAVSASNGSITSFTSTLD